MVINDEGSLMAVTENVSYPSGLFGFPKSKLDPTPNSVTDLVESISLRWRASS